jgi:hypothetical protein
MWTTHPARPCKVVHIAHHSKNCPLVSGDAASLGNTPRRFELHLPCCSHTLCLLWPSPLSLGAHRSWLVVATNARAYGHTHARLVVPPPPRHRPTRSSHAELAANHRDTQGSACVYHSLITTHPPLRLQGSGDADWLKLTVKGSQHKGEHAFDFYILHLQHPSSTSALGSPAASSEACSSVPLLR